MLFRESLVFRPDFVTIGFVLNDVTEPWRINRDFGGTGVDYHKITQTGSKAVGYLLNETGWGRLARWVTTIGKSKEAEKRLEVYNVGRLARLGYDDPQLRQAWDVALKDLAEVYAVADRNKVPASLLIFPFTFQFLREDLQEPQRILRAHAEEHGVPYIDFTPVFERLIFGEAGERLRSDPELDKSRLREMFADQIGVYFLDADHFTPEGHRVVAERILAYLERHKLLDPRRQACPSAN